MTAKHSYSTKPLVASDIETSRAQKQICQTWVKCYKMTIEELGHKDNTRGAV